MTPAIAGAFAHLPARAAKVAELYATGLTTHAVAERLGVGQMTVVRDLRRAGVRARRACPQGPRRRVTIPQATEGVRIEHPLSSIDGGARLDGVGSTDTTRRRPAMQVDPGSVAVAFSADRGWHMVNVPPAWALEMLADLE